MTGARLRLTVSSLPPCGVRFTVKALAGGTASPSSTSSNDTETFAPATATSSSAGILPSTWWSGSWSSLPNHR